MSDIQDLLAQLPIDQIADQLGVTPEQARAAAGQALPALFQGLAANAEDEAGATSIGRALGQHTPLDGGIDLGRVDPADGMKIVGHIFGSNEGAVVDQLADAPQAVGLGPDLTQRLLSLLAPLVLSYLAGKVGGKGGALGGGIGGALLQEVLKGALGGAQGSKGSGDGGILGDLLGGLLGGGRR